METSDIWPLSLTDEQITAELRKRHRTVKREWRRYVFWTLWYLSCSVVELWFAISADTIKAKLVVSFFLTVFVAYIWASARRWDQAQIQSDASATAISNWETMVAKGDSGRARQKIMESVVELQAAILVEQHNYEEFIRAKRAAKAAKKAKRGSSVGDGKGRPGS